MRARTILAAGCAAAVLLVAGCSEGTSGTATPAGGTTTTTTAVGPAAPTRTLTPRTTQAEPTAYPTIADYLADNGVTETPLRLGVEDPLIADFQLPDGWEAKLSTEEGEVAYLSAFGNVHQSDNFVPGAALLVSVLDGPVDAQELLGYASGEFYNLPGFEEFRSEDTDLDGFPAFLIIGGYDDPDFGPMVVSQRTAVVERDGVVYGVQLNVRALESQADAVDEDAQFINETLTVFPEG